VTLTLDNAKYGLSQHAYITMGDRYCILLDLHNDKYLALDRNELDAAGRWLLGWAADLPSTGEQLNNDEHRGDLVDELLRRGLLTSDRRAKSVTTSCISGSVRAINRSSRTGIVPRRRSIAFFAAAIRAHLQLRCLTIERTVGQVRKLKDHLAGTVCALRSEEQLEVLLTEFDALRPIFPRNYLCTFDSLALLHFLAAHGILADWVFGVRTDPFCAHCWLQKEDIVLNDTVEHVSTFDPIMCV
jgi:Transglutaminase-like superfamily